MKKKITFLPACITMIFLIISALMNCYTTFRHPRVHSSSDSSEVNHSAEITFQDDCSSCHEPNQTINDPYAPVYENPIYEQKDNWGYYYAIPWWSDQYYYENRQAKMNDNLPPTQKRDFDRREGTPSPAIATPGVSTPTLSKPAAKETTEPAPASSQQPIKRHERRLEATGDRSKSDQTKSPSPTRQEREKKETNKEQK